MYRFFRNHNLIYFLGVFFLLILSLYNIFYHLGLFPIYSWDEARHGVSAYEMTKNGNFIVNTYEYKNDYWNLKPPLSFWMIMIGYKIAGFNALGLRLMSGICALLTILIVSLFVYKRYGKLASFISMLTMSTCEQFLINHSARTGDADALFVFLFTAAILSLLLSQQNDKWLFVSGIAFGLAFLTKSWHAGNIVIIMGLYFIFTGKYKKFSFIKWFLLCLCMIIPILIWGIMRYHFDGITFFKNIIAYDLLTRSTTTIEGHVGGVFYYVRVLLNFFSLWIVILFGVLLVYLDRHTHKHPFLSKNKNDIIGLCLWILIPFLIFTLSKTKIRWYIIPVYPPLTILIGILAGKIFRNGKVLAKVTLAASLLFVSVYYEWQIQKYISHPTFSFQQNLLQKTSRMKDIKGYDLFYYHPKKHTKWVQSTVLTAELTSNFKVKNGDFHTFLQTNKALLMIKKDRNTQQFIKHGDGSRVYLIFTNTTK